MFELYENYQQSIFEVVEGEITGFEEKSTGDGSIRPDSFLELNIGDFYAILHLFGSVAQLVRALASHARGRGFEPLRSHQLSANFDMGLPIFFYPSTFNLDACYTGEQKSVNLSLR